MHGLVRPTAALELPEESPTLGRAAMAPVHHDLEQQPRVCRHRGGLDERRTVCGVASGEPANRAKEAAHFVAVPEYESEKDTFLHESWFDGRFFSLICGCFATGVVIVLLAGTAMGLPLDALDCWSSTFASPQAPGALDTETVRLST